MSTENRNKKGNAPWMNIVKKMGGNKKKKIQSSDNLLKQDSTLSGDGTDTSTESVTLENERHAEETNSSSQTDEFLNSDVAITTKGTSAEISAAATDGDNIADEGRIFLGPSPAATFETAVEPPSASVPRSLQPTVSYESHYVMDLGEAYGNWSKFIHLHNVALNVSYRILTIPSLRPAHDVQNLVMSPECQRLINSTGGLIMKTADVAIKTALLPVTLPINITAAIAGNIMGLANESLGVLLNSHQNLQQQHLQLTASSDSSENEGSNEEVETSDAPHEQLINAAMGFLPFAFDTAWKVKDEVGSVLMSVVSSNDNSTERSLVLNNSNFHDEEIINDNDDMFVEINSEKSTDLPKANDNSVSINETTVTMNSDPTFIPIPFTMRVCDLNLRTVEDSKPKLVTLSLQSEMEDTITSALNRMVDIALNLSLDDPVGSLEQLVGTGITSTENKSLESAISDTTLYLDVNWKLDGWTGQHIKSINAKSKVGDSKSNEEIVKMLGKELLTWTGTQISEGYGMNIPLLKGRGIIEDISPSKLVEILMDSSKVQSYNKYSDGRKDLHILQNDTSGSMTKIVENGTKMPFSNKMISVSTLLHARQLKNGNDEEFIIVSRSTNSTNSNEESKNNDADGSEGVPTLGSKNEVLWGVNILRGVPGHPNKVDLTIFSQANSSAIPGFLAHKVCQMSNSSVVALCFIPLLILSFSTGWYGRYA